MESSKIVKENISKLPKWAQEIINDLSRERDTAIRELNSYVDSDTASDIYIDEYVSIGENRGPTPKRHYIQGYTVTFNHAGIELDVNIFHDDVINLKWNAVGRGDVAFIPDSYQSANLVSKDTMR